MKKTDSLEGLEIRDTLDDLHEAVQGRTQVDKAATMIHTNQNMVEVWRHLVVDRNTVTVCRRLALDPVLLLSLHTTGSMSLGRVPRQRMARGP